MPGRERQSARQLLGRHKRAAARLRREVMGADGSLSHPYFRSLDRQLRDYRRVVGAGDLVAAAALADIVYVGDFHAEPANQLFTADLLERLVRRVPRVALGVEFVYTRQQRLLDRRQWGAMEDDEWLRRVHYRDEWGYPWEGYRELLDRARALSVPVHALDAPSRAGFSGLRRRDEHAAGRIGSILAADPETRLLVLFGESHLTRGHLPRRTKARLKQLGLERREVVVFQSPDGLYWKALEREPRLPPAVQVDDTTYAVLRSSPLEKYEAYRQVLARWRGDLPPDEEIDLTPAVHHLIDLLLGWLGIRAPQRRVRHRAGWTEDLVDAFPEVYSGAEALALLGPIAEEHGRTKQEVREARRALRESGALYESRSNTLFLERFLPGPAAGEAARFLRAALTGRLFIAADDFASDPAAAAYGAAYSEALAYLGAGLVDPTSGEAAIGPTLAGAAKGGSRSSRAASRARGANRWLESHRRFEASRRQEPPSDLLEALRRSRPLRRTLARELGRRLGQTLLQRVQQGRLDTRGLRRLFARPLEPPGAARVVMRLLRNPGPVSQ